MDSSGDSLGAETPKFQLIKAAELPPAWQVEVSEGAIAHARGQLGVARVRPQVCLELPDLGWAWKYQKWAERQITADSIPILVVAWDQFQGAAAEERKREAASSCLRSLLETGRPAPLFVRVFAPF